MARAKAKFAYWIWIHIGIVLTLSSFIHSTSGNRPNFQVVHFLDPSDQETVYYGSWNSDQWIHWLREKYAKEAHSKQTSSDPDTLPAPGLKGSWVHIVIIAPFDDFKIAYASDSMLAYTDPDRGDYYWSDYAFPVYVIIRSPNATMNITEDAATSAEEQESLQRVIYGYNVYNCADKKMFVNAKVDLTKEEPEPVHYQTFFPKKVKNPKEKLRIPLSVCSKVTQKRGLLDEIRFQLGNNIL